MKHIYLSFALSGLILLATSCSSIRLPRGGDFPNERGERKDDKEEREESGRTYPLSALDIPKGHLPPPGECKVWFPGRPPGQQPPPQSCASALRNAPLGAWVITHEGGRYKVNIFNKTRKGIVDEIRFYTSGK